MKNKEQHPGAILVENKPRTRRTKEEIEREKEEKKRRKEEKEEKRKAAALKAEAEREAKRLAAEQKRAARAEETAKKVGKRMIDEANRETAIAKVAELEVKLSNVQESRIRMGSTAPRTRGKRGRGSARDNGEIGRYRVATEEVIR